MLIHMQTVLLVCFASQTNYLVASWNQHIPTYCGSCYAHGTLNSVQDRIKVAKAAKAPEILLARQSFLNCGPSKGYGNGCGGTLL
jgi:cathepsin X